MMQSKQLKKYRQGRQNFIRKFNNFGGVCQTLSSNMQLNNIYFNESGLYSLIKKKQKSLIDVLRKTRYH